MTPEMAQGVLDACPDADWRLAFGLCRWGGLRCPSEVLRLRWADIDWEGGRITVRASKTEHAADQGIRQVPLFPELYPLLLDAFEQAEPGEVHCIARYRDPKTNLRTHLTRIIRQAGMKPWPKLFQNLRSTRETELLHSHPVHIVTAWMGHVPAVAMKHYAQVRDTDYDRAAVKRNPNRHPNTSERGGMVVNRGSGTPQNRPVSGPFHTVPLRSPAKVGLIGLEPMTSRV